MNISYRHTQGFIALFSALIISALLILLVIVSSTQSIFSRINEFDTEAHNSAETLALGCGSLVLDIIAHDRTYEPQLEGSVLQNGKISCTIVSITWSDDTKDPGYSIATIDTRVDVNSSFAKAETIASVEDPSSARPIPWKPEVSIISSRKFEE